MNVQMWPSSSGPGPGVGPGVGTGVGTPIAISLGSVRSLHGGGYYSSIGGGAAPFGPSLDLQSLKNGGFLKSCARQIEHVKRRRRAAITARPPGDVPVFRDRSTRMGKLYCRSGYHLQIHKDGKVNGTRQDNNRFGVLEFLSIAFGLVSIKGKETDRFLCMNRRGRLYSSAVHTSECVFMERMLENYYNTYTSCRYSRGRRSKKKWYLALNKRGRPKRGNQSRKKHKFTQFLVLHLDDENYKWTKRKFAFSNTSDGRFPLDNLGGWGARPVSSAGRPSPASSLNPIPNVRPVRMQHGRRPRRTAHVEPTGQR